MGEGKGRKLDRWLEKAFICTGFLIHLQSTSPLAFRLQEHRLSFALNTKNPRQME
jgi:hypothetical protein